MQIYNSLDQKIPSRKRAIAIGIFDGIHRGHQKILKSALRRARRTRTTPAVLTFEPHPRKVLRPQEKNPIIMSLPHRLRFFEKLGIKEAFVVRFDKRFSKQSREYFLDKLLLKRLGMKSLVVGEDFRFGRHASGDTAYLGEQAKNKNFKLDVVSPLKHRGHIISSTRIRRLVESGQLRTAEAMLGRPVSVYGTVVRGRGRGTTLGFPTANLDIHHETLPPSGVYSAWGYLNGRKLKGVIHIGERPTFGEKDKSVEVHFLDFHKDIYGREIELIFVSRLRPIRHFPDVQALIQAIKKDARKALQTLSQHV